MIEALNVSKQFDEIKAVENVSISVKEGTVFGLIGTNGSGKSTLMRMMAGILKPDQGTITIDGISTFEQVESKKQFFYISDEQFFSIGSTPQDLRNYYEIIYETFDGKQFDQLMEQFGLDAKRKIRTFSKGMKKQLSIICGICANTKYLLCDETFDGLDPAMRQAVKSIFAREIEKRKFTPIIASHNLRELEDICDYVGLLHKGGLLLSKDVYSMKRTLNKVQCVFKQEVNLQQIFEGMELLNIEQRGNLYTITVRGTEEEIMERINKQSPIFAEILPLTLEEIFISETGVVGYDIKNIIY